MNLVVDFGNTQTKCGIFSDKKLTAKFIFKRFLNKNLEPVFKKYRITKCLVSSVLNHNNTINNAFLKSNFQTIFLTHKTKLPIKNLYASPSTLGLDRVANVAAAASLFPHSNCLVIDAGTCIKIDFVNNKKEYLGGAISPGIMMRYKALHHYTDKLPLISIQKLPSLIGNSTKTSIASGVQNGALAEIENTIVRYKQKFKTIKVILTGGDLELFAGKLKSDIFAAPHLTLIGLNEILIFNTATEKN